MLGAITEDIIGLHYEYINDKRMQSMHKRQVGKLQLSGAD